MSVVYDLWFIREHKDREDTELHIGIYGSRADAEAAIAKLKDKPGFRDYPEGFEAHEVELGHTGWQYGFTTTIGPPPKDAGGQAFDLPAFD
jgi:homoserine kinase type II